MWLPVKFYTWILPASCRRSTAPCRILLSSLGSTIQLQQFSFVTYLVETNHLSLIIWIFIVSEIIYIYDYGSEVLSMPLPSSFTSDVTWWSRITESALWPSFDRSHNYQEGHKIYMHPMTTIIYISHGKQISTKGLRC